MLTESGMNRVCTRVVWGTSIIQPDARESVDVNVIFTVSNCVPFSANTVRFTSRERLILSGLSVCVEVSAVTESPLFIFSVNSGGNVQTAVLEFQTAYCLWSTFEIFCAANAKDRLPRTKLLSLGFVGKSTIWYPSRLSWVPARIPLFVVFTL